MRTNKPWQTSQLRVSPFIRFADGDENSGGGSGKSGGKGDDDASGKTGGDDKGKGDGKDGRSDSDDDEPLREPGKKALERERQRADDAEREKAALAARLKQLEDAGLTDQQKIERDLAEAKSAAAKATAQLLRYTVAEEKELPAGWANRLQGSTREELEADADALLKQLAATGRRNLKPDPSQGRGGGDEKKKGSVSSGADLYAEMHSAKK